MNELLRPASLDEAVAALAAQPNLKPIAGCTDLLVMEAIERDDLPAVLDLLAIEDLSGIEETEVGVRIGATTTFTEIRRSPVIQQHFPALVEAAASIGGWQIQNRATIGGNVVNASPAGDSLPVLLALGAGVEVASTEGSRRVPYEEFHTGYRQTALAEGELLTAIHLPVPTTGSRQAFVKVGTRQAHAISKVVVGALARVEDGRFVEVRFGAGSVAATPIRLRAAEDAVLGHPAGNDTAQAAGRAAADSVEPIDDVRSTARYRKVVLGRIIARIVRELGNDADH